MMLHLPRVVVITAPIALCIFLPFLPGSYDGLAVPLSTTAQLVAATSLLLVPIGFLWMIFDVLGRTRRDGDPGRRSRSYLFARASLITSSVLAVAVSLVVMFGVSASLGFLALVLWVYTAYRCMHRLRRMRTADTEVKTCMHLYLVIVPLAIVLLQLALGPRLSAFSRSRAIANSHEFISQIEQYHARHGRYPASLAAVWKDYYPDVIGIEKFQYSTFGQSYNLFFEQPKLLIDNFGTREFVVYNPSDDHRMFSHTSWLLLLSTEELERSQGWYTVHDTTVPHWKFFWFD